MSYSHKDESLRDELETHLSLLKRQKVISTWHDRKILPGDEFGSEIDENLENSDIILLLVSPYFIASDYCYDIEMKRALERHENDEARVIPIVLEHCDWKSAPFGKIKAIPKDGRPVTDYPNQHEALTEVATEIRKVVEDTSGSSSGSTSFQDNMQQEDTSTTQRRDPQRSSNLRVKKTFSDKEKDDFLIDSFEYVFKFFKNSLDELEERSGFIDSNIEKIDSRTFTVKIYKEEELVNECKVWRGSDFGSTQAIKYSNSIDGRNSYNMRYTVNDDGHTLYLESGGIHSYRLSPEDENKLSRKGASEQMWSKLIEPLQ
jgi:hypothetical protein